MNTHITMLTNKIDSSLLILFMIFVGYAIWLKIKTGCVHSIHKIMKKSFGKLLAAAIVTLMITKFVLFFFGNLYYIAKF